ncbi:MAG: YeeE/YedE family protein [Anaerolineae bacterium]
MAVAEARLRQPPVTAVLGPLAAIAIMALAARVDRVYGVFWGFGLAYGFALQRGRFCFASAFRDLFLLQQSRTLRAILAGMAVATLGFALIMSNLVPNTAIGVLPPEAHVIPLGLHSVVGGILFGIGMVLAGGCVSGTLYRMGEGYVASWVTASGILIGLWGASKTWNWWWINHISKRQPVWLPHLFGYGGAIALTLAALIGLFLLALWWEARSGVMFPEPVHGTSGADFRSRLRDLWGVVFVRAWPVTTTGIVLGAINVFEYAYQHPWGVTGELSRWADALASLVGLSAGPLMGMDQLAGCALTAETGGGFLTHGLILNTGLIFGSWLAATLAGEFKIRRPRQRIRYAQSIGGGVLMGYGAGLAVGCTIGAMFSAIPSLAVNGWAFAISLTVGAFVGVQVIRRLP